MVTDIHAWTAEFEAELKDCFGGRLWFFGLQGSYGRGEATAASDIDAVVILDRPGFSDLEKYRALLNKNPFRELLCGFVAGKEELYGWEKSDLLQLYLDTVPVYGSLEELKALFSRDDIRRSVLTGACTVYHGCVHNFLHERSRETLCALYKAACFTVRMKHYLETGTYIPSMRRLEKDDGSGTPPQSDRNILETRRLLTAPPPSSASPREQDATDSFDARSLKLWEWAKDVIARYGCGNLP